MTEPMTTVAEATTPSLTGSQLPAEVEELLAAYRDVERRALCLPALSFEPLMRFSGLAVVLYFFASFNVYLLPLNGLIWLLNKLPVRIPYVWIARRRMREAWTWLRRGEAAFIPIVVIRPWTGALVRVHFRNRLVLLRRRLTLDRDLSAEERGALLAEIDDGLELWRGLSVLGAVWTYGLQAVGISSAVTFAAKIPTLGSGTAIGGAIALLVVVLFAATPFMVKRGLMLGGSGPEAYFPGLIEGTGVYGLERRLFGCLGIERHEFPVDIALAYVYGVVPIAAAALGSSAWYFLTYLSIFGLLSTYALVRRRRVDRW